MKGTHEHARVYIFKDLLSRLLKANPKTSAMQWRIEIL